MTKPKASPASPAPQREEFLESLANGLALLRLFDRETPSLTIQLAAQRLGITRAAARRILLTLQRLDYLDGADGLFRPTPSVIRLGFTYFAAMRLPELAQPIVDEIVRQTGETANLSVLHGTEAVIVACAEPARQAFRLDVGVGSRVPAYLYSTGRVLLAALDDAAVDAVLAASDLHAHTPRTLVDPARIKRQVALARRDGYSVTGDEIFFGIGSISVPVERSGGPPLALSCGMLHGGDRPSMRERYLPILQQGARRLSGLLQSRSGLEADPG